MSTGQIDQNVSDDTLHTIYRPPISCENQKRSEATAHYQMNNGENHEENLCLICLENIVSDENDNTQNIALSLPTFVCSCSHQSIHPHCLHKWYNENKSCPICREQQHIINNSNLSPRIHYYHLEVSRLCIIISITVFFMFIIVFIGIVRYYLTLATASSSSSAEK